MDAHKLAQKLLKLPVSSVALPSEYAVREVMLGAYRLLKALCDCFKVTQLALIPQIPKIIGHIELKLVPVQRLKPDQTSGLGSVLPLTVLPLEAVLRLLWTAEYRLPCIIVLLPF